MAILYKDKQPFPLLCTRKIPRVSAPAATCGLKIAGGFPMFNAHVAPGYPEFIPPLVSCPCSPAPLHRIISLRVRLLGRLYECQHCRSLSLSVALLHPALDACPGLHLLDLDRLLRGHAPPAALIAARPELAWICYDLLI